MPVLSMPVEREITRVSDSDEDGGGWLLLHSFSGQEGISFLDIV